MDILSIIRKKRDGISLEKEEISFFIKNYTNGNITDYQAAALIMAIYINGMNKEETTNLAMSMAQSGDILDLSIFGKTVVEKHSTGGVGDKVSIIVLPIIASLGVLVAKTSGRGLGFTGGTIDKLKSIPGYRTDISEEEFIKNVKKNNISIISQTKNIAPADKKIYALRDTISCVESIPLIASSVMSKKIACGANKIVLDVTVGSGALIKNIENARIIANEMIEIGKLANREVVCIVTNMDEPLGYCIGNNLEVIEAVEFLKGNMPEDIKDVVLEIGAYMIKLAGQGENIEENKKIMLENIENKKAYQKFLQLVESQGGDIKYIEDTSKFEKAKYIEPVYSKESGIVQSINAEEMGKISGYLGAGRLKKEDKIDYTAGIRINKKVGDIVKENEIIAYLYTNQEQKVEKAKEKLLKSIVVEKKVKEKIKPVLEIISDKKI